MPTFAHDGFEFFYDRAGTGGRLLFCNGSGTSIEVSEPLLNTFRRSFDLGVHDQRGLGKTGLRPTRTVNESADEQWTMADYAADALALADELGWDTFTLFGVSFGGMVAQELAVTAPERVERLALFCTSPGGAGGSSYPLHTVASKSPDEQKAIGLMLIDSRFNAEWLSVHPADKALVDARAPHARRVRTPAEALGERLQLEARRGHDVWDRLARITCPTFIGCGRFDAMAPLANGEGIASRIAGSTLNVYEGGHTFFAQDSRALPDVRAFLNEA